MQSLAPYFVDLRAALNATTPAGVTNPRTVVLAADGDVDAYVDHSYLATRLGYNLVAGDDLVVRGGRVWLRSLSGLEEVSTVLRRVAELHADPLNVSPAGQGAVAGLGVVARAGQVGLANPFGTTLGGHLGLQPYLGEVCRMLLGEDLLLGSLATRWCGDPDQRAEVLEHLDRFVLHDTDPIRPADSVFATELDDASAAAWRAQIEKSPTRFVAQPRVAFAAGPSLRGNTLEPTVTMLRTQVVLGPQGPSVLPGALGRTIRDDMPALAQQGGIGRDVWVTADRAEPITVRLVDRPSMPQIDLRSSLPSRAAEALFWVGRNAERAEMGARVVRSLVVRFEQAPELLELDPADWLVPALAGLRAVTGGNAEPGEADSGTLIDNPLSVDPPSSTDSAVDLLVDDVAGSLGDRSGAIGDSILHLVVAARSVREFLSSATWRVLGALDTEREKLATMKSRADLFAVSESLDRVTLSLLALSGLAGESIVRGPGWLFLDIGRRVDRALLTVDLLDATVASVPAGFAAEPLYETVLGACESLVAYRRRHRSDLDFGPLVDLLVADPTNPRGVAFQLNRIAIDITELPDRPARFRQQERARILVERLRVQRGVLGRNEAARRGFSELLQALRTELEDLGADLMNTWFADRDEAHAVPGGAA